MTNKIYIGDQEINAGGGSSFDPTDINSSLNSLDASAKAFDASLKNHQSNITDLIQGYNESNSSIADISTRVETIESDYLTSDDISVYYTKSHIDSSYGAIDTSLKAFDVSAKAFDASIRELAQSGGGSGGGGGDMSNYATKDDISTFKPIIYTDLSTYEEDVSEGTIDENSMYVITDLASSDELSNIVTIEDLNAEKSRINDSLNDTADAIISAANTSCGYWKDQNVSQCQSQCNSAKTSAVSAVQSQLTSAVNAVNSAKNTAISDISTAADNIMSNLKEIVVLSADDYAEIESPNENTIYFITA